MFLCFALGIFEISLADLAKLYSDAFLCFDSLWKLFLCMPARVLSGVEQTGPPRWRTGPCRPTRPGPRAGRGRVADRATEGSAACRSGATRSLPTGYSAAAVLAKSVWQAGYALKRRGAESLRHGEGIPRTQVTMVRYGLVCLARSAAAEPLARSARGGAAAAEPLEGGRDQSA